jgi:hypothetical protein
MNQIKDDNLISENFETFTINKNLEYLKYVIPNFQTNYQQRPNFLNIFLHMNFLAKQIRSTIFIVYDFIKISLNTKHVVYMNIKQ